MPWPPPTHMVSRTTPTATPARSSPAASPSGSAASCATATSPAWSASARLDPQPGRDTAEARVRTSLPTARDEERRPRLGRSLARVPKVLELGATDVYVSFAQFCQGVQSFQ